MEPCAQMVGPVKSLRTQITHSQKGGSKAIICKGFKGVFLWTDIA